MPSKNKKKTKPKYKAKSSGDQLRNRLLDLFEQNPNKPLSIKQIIKKLGLRDKRSKNAVPTHLFELEEKGFLKKLRNASFLHKKKDSFIIGVVDYVSSRYAYVITPDLDNDVWVKGDKMKNAFHGDTVKVKVLIPPNDSRKAEGEVIEVMERERDEFVGRIEISPRYAHVIPDFKKVHHDFFIRYDDIHGAKHNDKVVVKLKEWPATEKNPIGQVVRVLGPAGDNDAEIHSIMAEFGLPFEFSKSAETQAKRIKEEITQEEIEFRRDFRGITTFTIDPEDAKDFDDAISFRKLENGHWEIGIHIADVSHFIKENMLLDKEALKRATSVYLVDRTIPMLPEKLSNKLCSLRPNEDKLTFSAVFEIDGEANILAQWFGKTIINSNRRFTYEEAQERIETIQGDFAKELKILNELALKLRLNRFTRGSINFETVEVKFRLDEKGKPLKVVPKIRKDAHKLIEEFMLLANKKVAEFIYSKKSGRNNRKTFVYRTHDYPDPEKIKAFSVFARKFGHKLNVDEQAIALSLNNLIKEIEGKPEENVLQQLAIRTMAKAKYTTEEGGHFGLAFPHYTHFTSPIRRYPDVMVHRLLFHYLHDGKSVDKNRYEDMCLHSSEMEKRAADAERASIKYKQVEFMQKFLGEDFEGVVSGVTEWGVYVEIVETKCEGMIRMSQMDDDYYEFDEQNYRIIGRNNKKMISLGDNVKVKVVDTDIDKRTIDLEFV
ncbi:MAG: ribonuclease R [Candidatus Cyclobacteriaceae bacterium M3_2C_046]